MMNHEISDNKRERDMMELTEEMLEAIAGGKRIVATGSVKVRTGPGRDFAVIGYLDRGDILTYDGSTCTDERGVKWYRVVFGVDSGWVSSRYSRKV